MPLTKVHTQFDTLLSAKNNIDSTLSDTCQVLYSQKKMGGGRRGSSWDHSCFLSVCSQATWDTWRLPGDRWPFTDGWSLGESDGLVLPKSSAVNIFGTVYKHENEVFRSYFLCTFSPLLPPKQRAALTALWCCNHYQPSAVASKRSWSYRSIIYSEPLANEVWIMVANPQITEWPNNRHLGTSDFISEGPVANCVLQRNGVLRRYVGSLVLLLFSVYNCSPFVGGITVALVETRRAWDCKPCRNQVLTSFAGVRVTQEASFSHL